MSLTPAEKETLVQYDMESRKFTVNTIVPKHIRRLTKLFGPGQIVDTFGTSRWVLEKLPLLR